MTIPYLGLKGALLKQGRMIQKVKQYKNISQGTIARIQVFHHLTAIHDYIIKRLKKKFLCVSGKAEDQLCKVYEYVGTGTLESRPDSPDQPFIKMYRK